LWRWRELRQANILPIESFKPAISKTRARLEGGSFYSERGVLLVQVSVSTSGEEWFGVRASKKKRHPRPIKYLHRHSDLPSARSNLRACRMRRKGGCSTRPADLALEAQVLRKQLSRMASCGGEDEGHRPSWVIWKNEMIVSPEFLKSVSEFLQFLVFLSQFFFK
jgi:hypothetical protein